MAWFIVAVFTLITILTRLHATTICGRQQSCFSENYTFTACQLPPHNLMVVNVTSSIEVSDTSCTFFDDSYDNYNGTYGVYGFCEGFIWVDKGCRAHFSYCISDESTSGVRNCSTDMFATTTPSPVTTTGISNTSNITTTTVSTSTKTSPAEYTNNTSPTTATSNQTESENSTSPTPTDSTFTTTNETDGEENSTLSTLMSFSSTSSTDASSTDASSQSSTESASDGSSPPLTDTSSSATTTISTTRESTSDEDVWKIPVYVGIIIIVVVLAIFLGCGILLLYLLCSQRQRRYSKSLVDIRDETDWKTENLRRYHKEELDAAVKNRNAIDGMGEAKNDTKAYLTPVSGAGFRAKGNLEESVGYLDVTTEGKIGFINPRYKNKSSDGKDSETADAMAQSGTRKPAGQTGSNAKGLEQSGGYESINPVDVKGK